MNVETFEAQHVPFFEMHALQTQELSEGRVRQLHAHIEQCPACRTKYVEIVATRAEFLRRHPPDQTIDALLRSGGLRTQPAATVVFSTVDQYGTINVVGDDTYHPVGAAIRVRIQHGAYAWIWTLDAQGAARGHGRLGIRRTRTFSTDVFVPEEEALVVFAFVGQRPLDGTAIAEWIACQLELSGGNPTAIEPVGLVDEDVLVRSALIRPARLRP